MQVLQEVCKVDEVNELQALRRRTWRGLSKEGQARVVGCSVFCYFYVYEVPKEAMSSFILP